MPSSRSIDSKIPEGTLTTSVGDVVDYDTLVAEKGPEASQADKDTEAALTATISESMNRYKDAMSDTFTEIMYGASNKKKEK